MINKLLLLFFYYTVGYSQISGCTDQFAKNFNPKAIYNDGSCRYKSTKIKPLSSQNLSDSLVETSGLIAFNKLLWTHNDDLDTTIYGVNTKGKIQNKIHLKNVKNTDWEEISQDSTHIYIGDFGNNSNGNRTDLHILKIDKKSFLSNEPIIDTITFSYSNQTDFKQLKPNKTNFDCEAFIVTSDSIYLFTKQWSQKKTSIYSLPKSPGNHIAQFKKTLNVNGLITGATLSSNTIVLCGYSKKLKPFVFLIYDFNNFNFSTANKRKIKLKIPFHQIEGIATLNGKMFYLTNESFVIKPLWNTSQKIHFIDLNLFINN